MQDYMQILIWTMLFVIVVEMVFPASDFMKYLKIILGCIIIYTIFTPIVKGGFWEQGKYDEYVREFQSQVGELQSTSRQMEDYEKQLLETYKQQEVDKISTSLKKKLNLEVVSASLVFDTSGYNPQIQEIYLDISTEQQSEQGKISISKIKIGEKDESLTLDQDNLKKEIKNCLGDFYNWDNVNININVQDN